jgi:hypothetical protein
VNTGMSAGNVLVVATICFLLGGMAGFYEGYRLGVDWIFGTPPLRRLLARITGGGE